MNKNKQIKEKEIKDAILLLGKGITFNEVAAKYKVTVATVYKWKSEYNKNGKFDDIEYNVELHDITFQLEDEDYKILQDLSINKLRTLPDQVKYLIKKELAKSLDTYCPF